MPDFVSFLKKAGTLSTASGLKYPYHRNHTGDQMERFAMIKSEAAVMQESYQGEEVTISTERRSFLSHKGQLLYGKYCGTHGQGICAESFAEYHTWRGEFVVVRDFLAFLGAQAELLRQTAPFDSRAADQLAMTERLIGRIETLLGEDSA